MAVCRRGRRSIEARTGKPVSTSANAADLGALLTGTVHAAAELPDPAEGEEENHGEKPPF